MKKLTSVVVVIIVTLLLISTNLVMAADDSLDIEKVAQQTLTNSQDVQSINRQQAQAQKNYSDIQETVNYLRSLLNYAYSYNIATQVILLPVQTQNVLTQVTNQQSVVNNATRLSAYKSYVGLLKANYALNIQKGLMDGLEADYKKAQDQMSLGLISQSQLRLAEIAYLKSKDYYNSAQNSLNSAYMAVDNMMGEKDITKHYATLQDDNIIPADQIKPLNDYVSAALSNRVEIINAQSTLDTQKKGYELGKSAMPSDFQLYCLQQQYAIDSAQNGLDLAKINVQIDITNQFKNLQNAMQNMAAMKDLDVQAEADYNAAQTKYGNYQITLKEFGDAKVAKAQADVKYKNAQLDAWLAQSAMDLACGIGYQPPDLTSLMSSFARASSVNKQNPTNPNDRSVK